MSSLVFLTPRSRTQRQRLALINVINSIRERNASVTERFVIERYRCDRIRKLDRLGRHAIGNSPSLDGLTVMEIEMA